MKLWQKDYTLNTLIDSFTVGNDYIIDHELVQFDCKASIAHAKMLAQIGILTKQEEQQLTKALQEIIELWQQGKFKINPEDEDCHTAIENYLTKKLGEVGQKIHTGRSRNDQILTALRLYEKDAIIKVKKLIHDFQNSLQVFTKNWNNVPMPGYTHMRKAMPTTVGTWFDSYAIAMDDNLVLLESVLKLIDKCPLGSGAGFGIPALPLDLNCSSKLLDFAEPFKNPIHIQNTRGKHEANITHLASQIMLDLNKLATDIITLSMSEFDFFNLDPQVCTGSSIMPQKKNPDPLELIRGYYHVVCGYEVTIKGIVGNLISGYHRDLQLIKQPLMSSFEITQKSIEVMTLIIKQLKVNTQQCKNAMSDELYATEKAYKLVKQGIPFRQAYQIVSKEYFINKENKNENFKK